MRYSLPKIDRFTIEPCSFLCSERINHALAGESPREALKKGNA